MANTITCPKCKTEIEITEVLSAQARSEVQAELEAQFAPQRQELEAQAKALGEQQAALKQDREKLDEELQTKLAKERKKLEASAQTKAREDLAVELQDRDRQLQEAQEKLKDAQKYELELRKRERDLAEKQEQLELETKRQMDKERDTIRQAALKQASEQHEMKNAEKDKVIGDLRKQMAEMQRKVDQGSQQTQGEVQELALEKMLMSRYPTDAIEEVPKGIRGADAIQRVMTNVGNSCGTILWESKRTKTFSKPWLAKLREDQRQANAAAAVIVTSVMPEGVETAAQIDGVWVCSWSCVSIVADLLRAGMMEAASARLALEGQQGKMEQVYNYLSGPQFKHRLTAVVEALCTMKTDLDKEKRAIQSAWAKREKQIERAALGAAGMHGDFAGIIGQSLPKIEGMDLPQLEADD
jgi:hypothetical protein